jgi:hypothetical protein
MYLGLQFGMAEALQGPIYRTFFSAENSIFSQHFWGENFPRNFPRDFPRKKMYEKSAPRQKKIKSFGFCHPTEFCPDFMLAPGLPDFSWYIISKPEKLHQMNTKCTKWS